MPIYEFACDLCGHDFEYLIRNGEAPVCPECQNSRKLTRRLSVPTAYTGGKSLSICDAPPASTCGRPQCGMGGCMGLE